MKDHIHSELFKGLFWSSGPSGIVTHFESTYRGDCQRNVRVRWLMALLNSLERSYVPVADRGWFVRWNNELKWRKARGGMWEGTLFKCVVWLYESVHKYRRLTEFPVTCWGRRRKSECDWVCLWDREVKLGTGRNKPISSKLISCEPERWKSESSMERKKEKGGGEWEQKIKERERRMPLIQFCMREKMAEQKMWTKSHWKKRQRIVTNWGEEGERRRDGKK